MTTNVLAGYPEDIRERILHAATSAPAAPAAPAVIETDPLAVQLAAESHPLNDEQRKIMNAVVGDGASIVIRARAGTGKTSTLEALARRLAIKRPDARILYIAFNRSVRQEAQARMPANVESRTGHSLAWRAVGPRLTGKLPGNQLALSEPELADSDELKYLRSRPKSVAKALGVSTSDVETVKMIVSRYTVSDDDELTMRHLTAVAEVRDVPGNMRVRERLLEAAQTYWDDLMTPLGTGRCRFRPTYDDIRKMWALSRPNFASETSGVYAPAQIVFLDEAQDTPPVLAKVVDDQKKAVQVCVVGDSAQAIYGFAGSEDYLGAASVFMDERLSLTTSYRFGDEIADVANLFLSGMNDDGRVTGAAEFDWVGPCRNPDAVLTRTNSGMIEEIIAEAEMGRTVGMLTETRDDLVSLVGTTEYLRDGGPKPQRLHKLLRNFTTWDEVKEEADQAKTMTDLTVALGIVSKWSLRDLSQLIASTVEVTDPKRADCDVVVVTAHKAKGLEWDRVRIGSDFYGPSRKPPEASNTEYDDPEHMRLNYVAVTRAKQHLDLGSLSWILSYAKGDQ